MRVEDMERISLQYIILLQNMEFITICKSEKQNAYSYRIRNFFM